MAEEQVQATEVAAPPTGPKQMKPGQTVCNERNEKGKLCAGPLKRLPDPKYRSKEELDGSEITYRCGKCLTIYHGPPLGYLRDQRMSSFVLSAQPEITPPEPKVAEAAAEKPKPKPTPKPAPKPE